MFNSPRYISPNTCYSTYLNTIYGPRGSSPKSPDVRKNFGSPNEIYVKTWYQKLIDKHE